MPLPKKAKRCVLGGKGGGVDSLWLDSLANGLVVGGWGGRWSKTLSVMIVPNCK